jgi:hypothetical protein
LLLLPLPLNMQSLISVVWTYCGAQRRRCHSHLSQIIGRQLQQFPMKPEPCDFDAPDIEANLQTFCDAFDVVKQVIHCFAIISAVKVQKQIKSIFPNS